MIQIFIYYYSTNFSIKACDISPIIKEKEAVADEESAALSLPDITSKLEYSDVLPNTKLEYTVSTYQVKENIIIDKRSSITSYSTEITAPGLTPELLDDKSVQFVNENDEIIFDIPAPFMYDNNDSYSENIAVRLNLIDDDTCELVYIPDYDWMSDSSRAYPVTIDPSYQVLPSLQGSSYTSDTYVSSANPNSNYYSNAYLRVGPGYESYVRYPTLPSISSSSIIQSARFCVGATAADMGPIRICRVLGSWASGSLTWNNRPGAAAFLNLTNSGQFYNTYDVTDVVSGWYKGTYPNYGFMIQQYPGNNNNIYLYSSESGNTNLMPSLQICYYAASDAGIATGVYFIRNLYDGKYLDVNDEQAYNGSNVDVWGFSGRAAQQWYVQNLGSGQYRISSVLSTSYSLDVYGGQDVEESNFNLWASTADRFNIRRVPAASGYAVLPTFSKTRAMDLYLGSDSSKYDCNVQLSDYHAGTNQQWEFERLNDSVCDYLNILHDVAKEYAMQHGGSSQELMFNYIRSGNPDYNSSAWSILAGGINTSFANYVEQRVSLLQFLKSPDLKLDDSFSSQGIDFVHMAATMDALFYSGRDEGGWAGDLQSLVKQVKNSTGNSDDYTVLYRNFSNLIGGQESVSSFSMSDVLADIDGKNLYKIFDNNTNFGSQLRNYLQSSNNRFSIFSSGYSYSSFQSHIKIYTNDRIAGVRQPYYLTQNVSTVTENQSLAAANAFADFIFRYN